MPPSEERETSTWIVLVLVEAERSRWEKYDSIEAPNRRAAEVAVERDLEAGQVYSIVPARSWSPQEVVVEQVPVRSRKAVDA